ncbi:MAG TPA: fasciclin domain-containing protein [Bacteroides mediterraneensis]|uniref:fasciclin domain-containing protein n=1 Tax=Bacteroides mediterraneensis TaxID=1841856 RepID=UPI0026ECB4A9|nr:fasciclin domain-containing protein [Bacteroides mediterraneensis]HJH63547.1 fasciclin domain-containing protein [Bacteroides mediterraneensis]
MKKNNLLSLGFSLILFSGCNMFGLELQENYDYDDSVFDSHTNMSVMDYMRTQPDMYSEMVEAIEYAGMESEYSNPENTYFVLTNNAFNTYFKNNRLLNPEYQEGSDDPKMETVIPSSITDYPQRDVQEFLKYHILIGNHNWDNLNSSTNEWIRTASYVENSPADTCLVLMGVQYADVAGGGCKININKWEGVEPDVEGTKPLQTSVSPLYSSLICTDGLVHVLDTYLKAPKKVVVDFYSSYQIK